jgi:hypothetical protein
LDGALVVVGRKFPERSVETTTGVYPAVVKKMLSTSFVQKRILIRFFFVVFFFVLFVVAVVGIVTLPLMKEIIRPCPSRWRSALLYTPNN